MVDPGYWIVISCGFSPERPQGRRWDATVVAVIPCDGPTEPDPAALAAERPGRVVALGVWSATTGWTLTATEGPPRLRERFAQVAWEHQVPTRAAIRLGIEAAMRLCLGMDPGGREPFPAPGVN